jgi:hypothetical protein
MRKIILSVLALPVFACGSNDYTDRSATRVEAIEGTVGDWSLFPDYAQCLVAVQGFYPAAFGAYVPVAREAWTGDCAPEGACHIWLDDIPDGATWERIPNDGWSTPSTYDLIVFPPKPGNPYGHIASVDHVDAAGNIYVMDANYDFDDRKAAAPHTVPRAPYGWYHLRSAAAPRGCRGFNDADYCGGNYIAGDPSTLYRCAGGEQYVVAWCPNGCHAVRGPENDACY